MPSPARVNIATITDWTGATGTTFSAPAQSHTAGNTLIVCVGGGQSFAAVTGISDTAGNTYTKVDHALPTDNSYREEIWYAKNIAGHASNVVTVTWGTPNTFRGIAVLQYAGLDPTAPFDATAKSSSNTNPVTTGTLTTTAGDEIHLLLTRWGWGAAITWPGGFTLIPGLGSNVEIAEALVAAPMSGTYAIGHAGAGSRIAFAAAFKPAAAVTITGTATITLDDATVSAAGEGAPIGTAAITLDSLSLTATGVLAPLGGGTVPPAPGPPVVDAQTGLALRLFVEIKGRTPVTPGAEVPRWILAAETGLRDPTTWYGGHKPARLISISPITRELADELRAVECRIVVADVDRFFRTYGTWGPLTGDYCAVYVVHDAVRYAEGVPYRLFAGLITAHRALPGFQYEFVVQDVFSTRLARLDQSPRVPPFRLTLPDFPGMDPSLDGKAAQIVLGEASDEFIGALADRGPQGVVPPQRLGTVNFQTLWGGSNIDTDAYIWSHGALVTGGVWAVYYNDTTPVTVTSVTQTGGVATVTLAAGHGLILGDTITIADATPSDYNGTWTLTAVTATTVTFAIDPATASPATGATLTPNRASRVKVPDSAWGVDVWTPGKPGWAMTGLATDYVDYGGHRYTPFFIRAKHPLAKDVREGKILVAGNLYGIAEHGDGTPPYLESAARLWQWIAVNQLFVPHYTGDYAPVPLLDELYGCIDTDSVEAAHAAHQARVPGGYVVGFLLGSEGKQETLRHVLGELCAGADMEQGINRHGQAMLAVEPALDSPDAEPIATLTDLRDIEDGAFETWVEGEAYVDRIEHQYGWRYVPPRAPSGTPKEGAPLPASGIPKDQQEWTSGLVVREHAAARALHIDKPPRVKHVENRVVRSPAVATNLETTWLARAVGPEPMFEGPLMFRLTTGWQGIGVHSGAAIDLGSVIAITHLEGYGQQGYVTERGVVRTITVDPQKARVTLEGRLLTPTSPATGPPVEPAGLFRVQAASATATGATTIAVTLATPLVVGHGVVVALLCNTGAPAGFAAATCTDNHGHTYLKAAGQQDGLGIGSVTCYYCPITTATGGVSTITVAPGVGAQDFAICAIEVGGVGAGLAVDVTTGGGAHTTTTAAQTTTVPTTPQIFGVGALVVRAAQASIGVSTADGMTPGWTQEGEALAFGTGGAFAGEVESRVLTTATVSLQVTWTLVPGGWWGGLLVGFKAT